MKEKSQEKFFKLGGFFRKYNCNKRMNLNQYTGKERVLLAFQHKEGDRVPIYEQSIASDVASKILGKEVYTGGTSLHYEEAKAWMSGEEAHKEFEEKLWEGLISISEYFEFDAIRIPWRMKEKPTEQLDRYTFLYGDKDKGRWCIYRYDPVSKMFAVLDSWENHLQVEDIPGIVKEMEETFSRRSPLTEEDFSDEKRLLDTFGEKLCVLGRGGIGIPYTPAWLEATLIYPEVVGRYLDMVMANTMEAIKIQAKMGIKVIWGGGDMASKNGPFYSPKTFRELMLPRLKKITELCNKLGVYYLFRSDGNLWPVAKELFVESGIHGYGEIEGDAGMDLERLKREYGHLTFWGNVSCDLLRRGSKKEVIEETKRCIDVAARGGGYILGSSNSILPGTPAENVIAMFETAKEYGRYS